MEVPKYIPAKKSFVAWVVVCLCGMAVFIVLAVYPFRMREEDTTEFTATVTEVVFYSDSCSVGVQEFSFTLTVKNTAVVDRDAMERLRAGDVIYFRLPQNEIFFFLESGYTGGAEVYALRTEEAPIITLESYHRADTLFAQLKAAVAFIAAALAAVAVVLLVIYCRRKKRDALLAEQIRQQDRLVQ